MEIKEGIYVRYKGRISKIVHIDNETFCKPAFNLDIFATGIYQSLDLLENCKTSNNIIDLIEVGDYVNGYPVVEITNHQILGKIVCTKSPCDWNINEQKIKSIVTKEQFENMSYKVG